MSRRKVRALTRTGRQVSEDPDIDNLLSNLSPEEMEELQKEVLTLPDPDPDPYVQSGIRKRTPLEKQPSVSNNVEHSGRETSKLNQRQLSIEGEPKRESLKQQYLRKMGLSQERSLSRSDSQGEEVTRQNSESGEHDHVREEKHNTGNRAGPSHRFHREESRDMERKEGREINEESKLREKREDSKKKEEGSSKTKELISKLQEKKEDAKEKERKDESRKDGKTKELISKLKERSEKVDVKEREKKEEIWKKEDSKTKDLISRLEEKQSQVKESKTDDSKSRGEEKTESAMQLPRTGSQQEEKGEVTAETENAKEGDSVKERDSVKEKDSVKEGDSVKERDSVKEKDSVKEGDSVKERDSVKEKDSVKEGDSVKERDSVKEKDSVKGREQRSVKGKENEKENVKERVKETEKQKAPSEGVKPKKNEEPVAGRNQSTKTKENDEEEDEDASMFDELLEKVSSNDPQMTELNVNNSEAIKTKTLINFAEALRDNTHIKIFALANTRADDHVAYAIAGMLRANKTVISINLDSNHLTSKGIVALIHALQHNSTLTELRFHNQRHICGGKTEMEMAKILKENTTLLKLGYHFELAGPRMTMTNILSRNMDRQRQRRLQEQKQAQANGEKKGTLEVPKASGGLKNSPKASPKVSPLPSPQPSPKVTPKKVGGATAVPPPPPPPPPPGPVLDMNCLRDSLTPVSQRKMGDKGSDRAGGKNSRDQLLASIRNSNVKQLKKVDVPKLLQ
nr:leiomodin-1 isoform X2 [Paramormyrops kingsleyae]